jgi:carbon monoxide dehydrogenase subunit G
LEQSVTIPVPPDAVWAFVMDIPSVAQCVPGVEQVEDLGDGTFRGLMRIRVGPIALAMAGTISVRAQDPSTRSAVIHAEATDRRALGSVRADVSLSIDEGQAGEPAVSRLRVQTDAQIMGKLGEFGQAVIRRKADQIMNDFVTNIEARLAG